MMNIYGKLLSLSSNLSSSSLLSSLGSTSYVHFFIADERGNKV